jgi:hypothetical protein
VCQLLLAARASSAVDLNAVSIISMVPTADVVLQLQAAAMSCISILQVAAELEYAMGTP